MSVDVSVILCTYNPRTDYFALALRSIGAQNLPQSHFEFIVVDNNSAPALDIKQLERIAGRPVQLVRETKQGLTHARIAGLQTATADLVVFVDDDNELAYNYLQESLKIAKQYPRLGAFGGISEGVLEKPVGKIKFGLLPQLGIRNYGDERIEGQGDQWGQWEPIGAGMVVRKEVGLAFATFVNDNTEAANLGRKNNELMGGEDSLFSRLAHRLNYSCAYQPELKLKHYMSANRLKLAYLLRLIYNQGRSYVLLAKVTSQSLSSEQQSKAKLLLANFRHRLREESFVTAALMVFWDSGFHDELNR